MDAKVKIGLFGTGLHTYWGQFDGLLDELNGYRTRIRSRMERTPQIEVVDGGMVDSPERALEAFHFHAETAEELLRRYPGLSAHERETAATKEFGTVFLMGIGGALSDGKPHDGRAPDYDDWTLNGDILFYDEVLGESLEISSMGIRVDADALARQLKTAGAEDRLSHDYHKMVMSGELPLTVGGGIGQSRLCMLLLGKAHIGEVQASLWPEEMIARCAEAGIHLL